LPLFFLMITYDGKNENPLIVSPPYKAISGDLN
jgi:hypothetical protein